MELVSRLTAQDVTPGTADTAFSTRAEQAAQLMPVTEYCCIFVIHTYLLLHLHGFSFPTGFVGITHGVIIYQKSVLVNRKNGFSRGNPLKIHGGYDIM